MKRAKSNRVIFIFSLIISIGIMGVGYGQWKDDINILGNITTGEASIIVLQNDSLIDKSDNVILKSSTCEPGKLRIPFTIINNGTVPMKLDRKSDNIEFECDELLSNKEANGFIIVDIIDKQIDSYNEEVNGFVEMICMNGSWVELINITAIIDVNIPIPKVKQTKTVTNNSKVKECEKSANTNKIFHNEDEKNKDEDSNDDDINEQETLEEQAQQVSQDNNEKATSNNAVIIITNNEESNDKNNIIQSESNLENNRINND